MRRRRAVGAVSSAATRSGGCGERGVRLQDMRALRAKGVGRGWVGRRGRERGREKEREKRDPRGPSRGRGRSRSPPSCTRARAPPGRARRRRTSSCGPRRRRAANEEGGGEGEIWGPTPPHPLGMKPMGTPTHLLEHEGAGCGGGDVEVPGRVAGLNPVVVAGAARRGGGGCGRSSSGSEGHNLAAGAPAPKGRA